MDAAEFTHRGGVVIGDLWIVLPSRIERVLSPDQRGCPPWFMIQILALEPTHVKVPPSMGGRLSLTVAVDGRKQAFVTDQTSMLLRAFVDTTIVLKADFPAVTKLGPSETVITLGPTGPRGEGWVAGDGAPIV